MIKNFEIIWLYTNYDIMHNDIYVWLLSIAIKNSYLKLYNDLKYLKLHNCVQMISTRNTWFHITMQIIYFKNDYLKLELFINDYC